jgi:hypothetical protein
MVLTPKTRHTVCVYHSPANCQAAAGIAGIMGIRRNGQRRASSLQHVRTCLRPFQYANQVTDGRLLRGFKWHGMIVRFIIVQVSGFTSAIFEKIREIKYIK